MTLLFCGDIMEKLVEIGILYDFYGKLLSEKQLQTIELYYIYDLSLTEIGEELDITKQGVSDTLKRAERKLYRYEDTLGLVGKFRNSHKNVRQIVNLCNELKRFSKENSLIDIEKRAQKIEDICLEILE